MPSLCGAAAQNWIPGSEWQAERVRAPSPTASCRGGRVSGAAPICILSHTRETQNALKHTAAWDSHTREAAPLRCSGLGCEAHPPKQARRWLGLSLRKALPQTGPGKERPCPGTGRAESQQPRTCAGTPGDPRGRAAGAGGGGARASSAEWPSPARRQRQQKAEEPAAHPRPEVVKTRRPAPFPAGVCGRRHRRTGTVSAMRATGSHTRCTWRPGHQKRTGFHPGEDSVVPSLTKKNYFSPVIMAHTSAIIFGCLKKRRGTEEQGGKKKNEPTTKQETQSSKCRLEIPLLWAIQSKKKISKVKR